MTELKKRVLDALNGIGGCGANPGSYEKGWDGAIDAAYRTVKALDDAAQEARWIPVDSGGGAVAGAACACHRLPRRWQSGARVERCA